MLENQKCWKINETAKTADSWQFAPFEKLDWLDFTLAAIPSDQVPLAMNAPHPVTTTPSSGLPIRG
jgi:hypothetical protein